MLKHFMQSHDEPMEDEKPSKANLHAGVAAKNSIDMTKSASTPVASPKKQKNTFSDSEIPEMLAPSTSCHNDKMLYHKPAHSSTLYSEMVPVANGTCEFRYEVNVDFCLKFGLFLSQKPRTVVS